MNNELILGMQKLKLTFWSELLSYNSLPKYLPLLAENQIALNLAVRPALFSRLSAIINLASDLDLELWLWPLLSWRDGYWVNSYNIARHIPWVHKLVNAYPNFTGICLDLESPINFRGFKGRILTKQLNQIVPVESTTQKMHKLIKFLHDQGKKVMLTSLPFNPSHQAAKGCPIIEGADLYSYMFYTSFLRPFLPKQALDYCVYHISKKIFNEFGPSIGSIDLGLTSYGVVNKMIHLADLIQIRDEMNIALAAGITQVHVFALDFITPDLSNWIHTLQNVSPIIPDFPNKSFSKLVYRVFSRRLLSEPLNSYLQ
jgi:hypothetical protein